MLDHATKVKNISATTTALTAESNIRLCVIVFYCSTKSLTAVNSAVKQVFFAVKWMWYSAHDRSKEQSRQRTNINNLCQTKTLRKQIVSELRRMRYVLSRFHELLAEMRLP